MNVVEEAVNLAAIAAVNAAVREDGGGQLQVFLTTQLTKANGFSDQLLYV